jgi:hypothetical protein
VFKAVTKALVVVVAPARISTSFSAEDVST